MSIFKSVFCFIQSIGLSHGRLNPTWCISKSACIRGERKLGRGFRHASSKVFGKIFVSNEEIIEDWAMGSQCKAGGDLIEKA